MSEISTEIAKPFELNNPGPLDKNRGPYATVAIACQAIPNITKLVGGVSRNLREGKIVDIGIEPNTIPHNWKGGFADANLLPCINSEMAAHLEEKKQTVILGISQQGGSGSTLDAVNFYWNHPQAITLFDGVVKEITTNFAVAGKFRYAIGTALPTSGAFLPRKISSEMTGAVGLNTIVLSQAESIYADEILAITRQESTQGAVIYQNLGAGIDGSKWVRQTASGFTDSAFGWFSYSYKVEQVIKSPLFKLFKTINDTLPLRGKKVVIEGDSIMENGLVTGPLATISGSTIVNKAKGGTGFAKPHVNGTIRSRVSAIAATLPDLVFIAGGTNDFGANVPLGSAEVINDDSQFYSAVYNTLRVLKEQNKTVPVVIATPIQRFDQTVNSLGYTLNDYRNIIKEVVARFALSGVDMYSVSEITFENKDLYLSDGLHPNSLGGGLMARKIADVISRVAFGGSQDISLPFINQGLFSKKSDIVNDLTTGGVSKILSAEQGKIVGDALFDERTAVLAITSTITALATGNPGKKILSDPSLSNEDFTILENGDIVANKNLYLKVVSRTDWTMTNMSAGVTRTQLKVNDSVFQYDLARPTGTAVNTNKIETPTFFLPKGGYLSYDIFQNSGQSARATSVIKLIRVIKPGLYLTGRNTPVNAVTGAETATIFETTDFGDLDITNEGNGLRFNKSGLYNIAALVEWTYTYSTNPVPLYLLLSLNGVSRIYDKTVKANGGDWSTHVSGTLWIDAGMVLRLMYNVASSFATASPVIKRSKLGIREVTGFVLDNALAQPVQAINTDLTLSFNNVVSGYNKLTGFSGDTQISGFITTSNSPATASNVDLKILKNNVVVATYRKNVESNQTFSFSIVEKLVSSDIISFKVNAGYLAVVSYATVALTAVPVVNDSKLEKLTEEIFETKTRLNELIGTGAAYSAFKKQSFPGSPFDYMDHTNKIHLGATLQLGTSGEPDAGMIESQFVWFEPSLGLFVSIFTQYSSTSDVTAIASIGWATSPDGVIFTKKGTFFSPKGGLVGNRMEMGITGPVMVIDPIKGKYHLFYIALTEAGYENGTKSLCRADGTSIQDFISNTAVRHPEPVISVVPLPNPVPKPLPDTAWRSVDVYKPCFVFKDGLWYCFFNAGGVVPENGNDRERIGYATSTALDGIWTVDDINSPLLPDPPTSGKVIGGDPSIIEIGDYYIMAYFTQLNSNEAHDEWAYTLKRDFPLKWQFGGVTLLPGPAGSIDSKFAHKPVLFKANDNIYHYYTAVDLADKRLPALAVSKLPYISTSVSK